MKVIDLAALDGAAGFRIRGANLGDSTGMGVASAGDMNGDGYCDIIIGSPGADPFGRSFAGSSHVVFGKAKGFAGGVNLGSLAEDAGFRLDGDVAGDQAGYTVASARDVNNDGFDDIIIGAFIAAPGGRINAGSAYVAFGKSSGFAETIQLGALNGASGFRIDGAGRGNALGLTVASAGDLNGDGYGDVALGGWGYPTRLGPGVHVVFGKAGGFSAAINVAGLDGNNGFRIADPQRGQVIGQSVASAGDFNGDGIDDLIVSTFRSPRDPGGEWAGQSFVLFGSTKGFSATTDLLTLNGETGFRIDGAGASDGAGVSVASAGDLNGDGLDDLIIGATRKTSYVVFGKAGAYSASINLGALDGLTGFRLDVGNRGGSYNADSSVASAGDFNGDGFGDLVIVNREFGLHGGVYVFYGRGGGFAPVIDLSMMDDATGIFLYGEKHDNIGFSVASAGDFNGDGFDDLIIGAPGVTNDYAGAGYVVFGFSTEADQTLRGGEEPDSLTGGTGADLLLGKLGDDTLKGGLGDDTLIGRGGADLLDGGAGFDTASFAGAVCPIYADLAVWSQPTGGAPGRDRFVSIEALEGGDFADTLAGDAGDNLLSGGAGDDLLVGGRGQDTLVGGEGADLFRFIDVRHGAPAAPDLIRGFDGPGATPGDRIDVSAIDADRAAAGDQAFLFGLIGGGGLWTVDDGSDTLVMAQPAGSGAPAFMIRIEDGATTASTYAAADFVL